MEVEAIREVVAHDPNVEVNLEYKPIIRAIMLATMRDGLTWLNVQAFYQLLATGIIIVATLIDRLTRGKE